MKRKYFHLSVRETFFTVRTMIHWNNLPREVVKSSLLKVSKRLQGDLVAEPFSTYKEPIRRMWADFLEGHVITEKGLMVLN